MNSHNLKSWLRWVIESAEALGVDGRPANNNSVSPESKLAWSAGWAAGHLFALRSVLTRIESSDDQAERDAQ